MDVNEIMKQKNITLPEPPPKGGVYAPCRIVGNLAFISGCGCIIGDMTAAGKLGRDYTLEQGQEFARNSMLNVLAVLKREIGDLNRVRSVVKLLVFVASDDEFYQQPQVANGASALLGELPVEIEALFEIA